MPVAEYLTAVTPPDLAQEFKARAEAEDRSTSSLLRLAMRGYLQKNGDTPAKGAADENRGQDPRDATG